ncbi:metallophosphoesterase [Kaarinaea lacus]
MRKLGSLGFACSIVLGAVSLNLNASPVINSVQSHGKFEFALIGDAPYGVPPGTKYPPFDALIKEVNNNHRLKWLLHAGDIKSGSTECSEAMFMDRLERYDQFNIPVVLTLGDNEWADCHRVAAGQYQPLERLAKLREVFFNYPGQTIGGQTMEVETQAAMAGYEEFPENVRWTEQNIVFATMHIVGSNNAENDFPGRTVADDEEVVRRTNAALAWLDSTFAMAKAMNSPGVFLMIHANPDLELSGTIGSAFSSFIATLESHVIDYGKPVVLAHGDSHYFRVDKPAMVNSGFLKNFTRVETFGSSNVHWLRVSVNPNSEEVFTIHQEIIKDN